MDDLISRSALLAEYDRVHVGPPGGARKLIEDAPSAPRKGKWIYRGESESFPGNNEYECSVCGFADAHSESQEVPFCWHCGALMVKGEDNEL